MRVWWTGGLDLGLGEEFLMRASICGCEEWSGIGLHRNLGVFTSLAVFTGLLTQVAFDHTQQDYYNLSLLQVVIIR